MPYGEPAHLKTDEFNTKNDLEFYTTSNMRDFSGLTGPPADNARPGTSPFYSQTESGPTGYGDEFGWKTVVREEPTRTGTSSGQRANNPHPKESFMVWKFPDSNKTAHELVELKAKLMREICDDKLNSTYQEDYKGLQQGEREPLSLEKYQEYMSDKQHVPERTINTTVRHDYRLPRENILLKGNNTRYGCNAKKMGIAKGAVPTVVNDSPLLSLQLPTSYAADFDGDQQHDCVLKPSAIPTLNKIMSSAQETDRRVLENMLHSLERMKICTETQGKTKPNQVYDRNESGQLERLSEFDGPSWK